MSKTPRSLGSVQSGDEPWSAGAGVHTLTRHATPACPAIPPLICRLPREAVSGSPAKRPAMAGRRFATSIERCRTKTGNPLPLVLGRWARHNPYD